MIETHTLETLEFSRVISLIQGKCLTPYGRNEVSNIAPRFDISAIELRQTEISQMKDILRFGLPFPLYRTADCREILAKATIQGIFLEPDEIRTVLELIQVSGELHTYDLEGREKFPAVSEYLAALRPFPELRSEIVRTIDERGDIKDDASPQLRRVRLDLAEGRRKIINRLEQVLGGQRKQAGWADDVVTQRNGRYVISVPASNFRNDLGILHDRSQSGATLFVEPKETVELNNRINLLIQDERLEIDRILRALTAQIATRQAPLVENTVLLGKLDAMHAAAGFAIQTESSSCRLSREPMLNLIDARHPLLIAQLGTASQVVPLTVNLDQDRQAILVTGPNTGGKTIALKTIGLLSLMAQAGLLIPANENSTVGIFKSVYADIGDEQSIELSLSTFSSHIRNIIHAVRQVAPDALILFDEIGAGTDPKEGAALAEAIILHIVENGAKLVATTHYSQLKTLPLTNPLIENASLEFDRETLAPTYELRLGLPGSSYAVEIAGRLGLPEQICARAAVLVGSGERSLTELISSLEAELLRLKEDRIELTRRLEQAKAAEESHRAQLTKFSNEIELERKAALTETASLLESTRKETERLVAEIRESQASKTSVKELHKTLKSRTSEMERLAQAHAEALETIKFQKGDTVRVVTLNQEGQIAQLIGQDRARIRIGNITTIVELRHLRQSEEALGSKPRKIGSAVPSDTSISPEIHLRGMTGEEALEALDRFLDRAVVAGLGQIYVIHGKGTGALRRTVTEYLKKHNEVLSFELGNWNEGGAGVTVVKLKT